MGKVIEFKNKDLCISVRSLLNEDGSITINAEDAAIGFGWTQTQKKGGKQYCSIRWERMNKFSEEIGFPHKWGKDDFMPESLFYRLAMKANNELADKFQEWLSTEVIPQIRKTGGYIPTKTVQGKALTEAEIMASALIIAQRTIEARELALTTATEAITTLQPKADYADKILQSKNLMNARQIAQDYGMSAIAFNKLLASLGVQYKDKRAEQWILTAKYKGLGWVGSTSKDITRSDGTPDVHVHTKWTQVGRKGLYDLLKKQGYVPVMESEHQNYLTGTN